MDNPNHATKDLLQRLLARDPDAWRQLVRDHSGLLLGLARRTLQRYSREVSEADAEDAVAEAWRSFLAQDMRQVRRCAEFGNLLPTLAVLVRNRAVDILRARKLDLRPLDGQEPEPAPPAAEPGPEMEIPPADLQQALAALAPRERAVLTLFYLQGKRYREIAGLTGMAFNSIGPTLSRALRKLREALPPAREEAR